MELQKTKHEIKLFQWSERIADCRSSGMQVQAWCHAQGISPSTYYRWQRQVWDAGIAQAQGRRYMPTQSESAALQKWTRLEPAPAGEAITVEINGFQIDVTSETDRDMLMQVWRLLKELLLRKLTADKYNGDNKSMEHIDLRKMNNDELYTIRKQVVRLKKQGRKGAEIEEITGLYQTRISQIWKAYQKDGNEGILPQKSGRKEQSQMLLTTAEQREIRQTIISKAPNQLKLAGFLWTLAKISQYIWDTYRKKVSKRCLSNYMKRWGLTCQRPTKRACGQDIARIEKFKAEEYPAIAKRAKAENAEIYWGDETGVSNAENFERGFSEKGHPPVLPVETKHERVNMISAITNQGHTRFMVYEEKMNQRLFLDFLRRLVADSNRKIFFIVDNLRVHHGKIVAAWLEKHKDKIEVFFLPPYAPESNPDEYLNHALKRDVHSGDLPRTTKDITHKIHSFMRRLQHHSDRVRAFFRHPCVVYCCVQE